MGANSGQIPSPSSTSALMDLPDLVQTVATQRRSGTLLVQFGEEQRKIYFSSGQVRAFCGPQPLTLGKALVWAGIINLGQLEELIAGLGADYKEQAIIQAGEQQGLLKRDGLLDAVDCYIEEGFAEMVTWVGAEFNFVTNLVGDSWAQYQAKIGINVAAGSVLLEALRRQDELKSVSAMIPDSWDVMVRDAGVPVPGDLPGDQQVVLAASRLEGRSVGEVLNNSGLAPFRGKRALVHLRQQGVLRLATPAEVVVQADIAYARGNHREALGLYQRALVLGMDSPRIFLHVAELAEKLGETATAAKAYAKAGSEINETGNAVIALRNALRLGADREGPLTQLLNIYRQMGETDDAIAVLIELAQHYEQQKNLDQCAQAVSEAQELGADPTVCAKFLARLALAEGDTEQAVLQLEQVARAAHLKGQRQEASEAWRQLLEIMPGRCEYAYPYAELLAGQGMTADAVRVIRQVLAQQKGASDDVLVGMYELLAKVHPGDFQAHEWLAKAYQRRKNRDGATEQLRLVAAAQEKENDFLALAVTLENILSLAGEEVESLKRLAVVYARLGQDGKANTALCRAVDAALALSQLKEARQICESAVELDPSCLPLRARLAHVANREGDRAVALTHFRAAAHLARGTDKLGIAKSVLIQIRRLRPDDLLVRVELADLALDLKDPDLDRILRDLVHFALRNNNYGLAVERARMRVQLGGPLAIDARLELVELFRRMGDRVNELKVGRELLNELLEQAEFDKAVELLQRLVASNSRNADLVLQLAELYAAMGDTRPAQRFYRHGVCLLQLETRIDEAKAVLDQLGRLASDSEAIAIARDMLDKGQVLEWEAIRWSLSQDQRRRIADEIEASGAVPVTAAEAPKQPAV